MVDENEEQSDAGFTQIKPAAVNLTSDSSPDDAVTPGKRSKQQLHLWLGFGALLASAAVVIFLLPRWVTTPAVEPPQVPAPSQTGQIKPAQPGTTVADSPWNRAQQLALRKETQEILAQMLDAKKTLDEHGVTQWAAQEYTLAIQHAQSGDNFYNQRDFSGARTQYRAALDILTGLVEQIDEVFAQTMERGNKALAAGNSTEALQAFQIALAIDTIDRNAKTGIERAQKLDEVMALIKQGDNLLDKDQLEQARTLYQQALDLDGNSTRAKERIRVAGQKIKEREFSRHMSSGFTALENRQFDQARLSFSAALRLKPNSAEAQSALNQARHAITSTKINTLLEQAGKLEAEERWHEALSKYNSALALNAALADAQAGRERTTIRAKLHDQLEQILNHPDRLYNEAVYAETMSFYKKINALSNPGPVLTAQLSALKGLLEKAATPLSIRLESDNLTKVTLHKYGELGYFTSKELSLRPGHYVAVGQRDGYRDVRIEIDVDPDKPISVITVQATEKIAFGTQH